MGRSPGGNMGLFANQSTWTPGPALSLMGDMTFFSFRPPDCLNFNLLIYKIDIISMFHPP